MYYTLTTWVFICDKCRIRDKVISDDLKLPIGWRDGHDIEALRASDYNSFIANYNKHFCSKCVEKFEIGDVFK